MDNEELISRIATRLKDREAQQAFTDWDEGCRQGAISELECLLNYLEQQKNQQAVEQPEGYLEAYPELAIGAHEYRVQVQATVPIYRSFVIRADSDAEALNKLVNHNSESEFDESPGWQFDVDVLPFKIDWDEATELRAVFLHM